MKNLLSLACILLFAGLLPAQQDDFPAVVVSSKGKVQYVPADKSGDLKIASGAVIKKTGTIKIKGGGSAIVYCNGRMQRLKGKGMYALPELFKPGGLATLNFEPEFGKYVRASVAIAANKQGGDGWGTGVTDPKQGGDGWGGKGANIILILPFGKLTPDVATFAWSKPAGANMYQLEILDENSKILHSSTTADTFTTVDLRKLNLTPNQVYSWKVSVPGNSKLSSSLREFTPSTPEEQAAAAQKAASSAIYRDGGPVVRGLMEAIALEKAKWHTAAGQQFETLLRQNPKDNMVRIMYAAFWMYHGLEPKAKAVMQP